jgi:hypothetical protein
MLSLWHKEPITTRNLRVYVQKFYSRSINLEQITEGLAEGFMRKVKSASLSQTDLLHKSHQIIEEVLLHDFTIHPMGNHDLNDIIIL